MTKRVSETGSILACTRQQAASHGLTPTMTLEGRTIRSRRSLLHDIHNTQQWFAQATMRTENRNLRNDSRHLETNQHHRMNYSWPWLEGVAQVIGQRSTRLLSRGSIEPVLTDATVSSIDRRRKPVKPNFLSAGQSGNKALVDRGVLDRGCIGASSGEANPYRMRSLIRRGGPYSARA